MSVWSRVLLALGLILVGLILFVFLLDVRGLTQPPDPRL